MTHEKEMKRLEEMKRLVAAVFDVPATHVQAFINRGNAAALAAALSDGRRHMAEGMELMNAWIDANVKDYVGSPTADTSMVGIGREYDHMVKFRLPSFNVSKRELRAMRAFVKSMKGIDERTVTTVGGYIEIRLWWD